MAADRHTRSLASREMAERAWRVLRDKPEIEFMACDLPAGVRALYVTRGPDKAILVNRSLPAVERLAALAHELKHHERGGGCHHRDTPPLLHVATKREEARVDALVADELLPQAELEAYAVARAEIEPVMAWQVAEDLDVALDVAERQLRRLASGF